MGLGGGVGGLLVGSSEATERCKLYEESPQKIENYGNNTSKSA